jgi:hypothetical protein
LAARGPFAPAGGDGVALFASAGRAQPASVAVLEASATIASRLVNVFD